MFEDELLIGSIRAQSNRLRDLLSQLENDGSWRNNPTFYADEMKRIEKCLRMIRKSDLESIYECVEC